MVIILTVQLTCWQCGGKDEEVDEEVVNFVIFTCDKYGGGASRKVLRGNQKCFETAPWILKMFSPCTTTHIVVAVTVIISGAV